MPSSLRLATFGPVPGSFNFTATVRTAPALSLTRDADQLGGDGFHTVELVVAETEAMTVANHGMTLTLAVDHDGVLPAGELDGQASDVAAVEPRGALDGLRQSEPLTSGLDGRRVADFRLDRDNVRHRSLLVWDQKGS